MLKNTEVVICFILFTHKFSDRFYGSYMIESSDFDKIVITSLRRNGRTDGHG